jgi:competence protein ComEC
MNVGLISFFVFLLLKLCRVRKKAAAVVTMIFITVFAVVTGAGASIVRATVMAYAVLLGIILERDTEVMNSLAVAALAILLFNPLDLLDIGFQMSFLATFGIIYFSEYSKKLGDGMPEWLSVTLFTTISAQVFLLPVMANTFHQVSLISVLANLFIVPLSGLISILGFVMWLFGSFIAPLARVFGASIWALINAMGFFVDIFASVPYASVSVKSLPDAAVLFYSVFFLILPHRDIDAHYKFITLKEILGGGLAVFFLLRLLLPGGGAGIYALAAKDMNAVFIKTPDNKKVLIIGCDDYEKSAGTRNVIVPFLRQAGVNNIDSLIMFSVKNPENVSMLKRNFRVGQEAADEKLYGKSFYSKIGRHASMDMDPYGARLEHEKGVFIFTKLLAGRAVEARGAVIYSCFFSMASLGTAMRDNTCVVNSGTLKGFYNRGLNLPREAWDVNEKGHYFFVLKKK